MADLDRFNFNVPYNKSYGCVLVDADVCEQNTTSLFKSYKKSKEDTGIKKILKTNLNKNVYGDVVKEGDVVLLTSVMSRAIKAISYKMSLDDGTRNYANIHMQGIAGIFKGNNISFNSFQPIFGKVIAEKVTVPISKYIVIPDHNITVLKVVKSGDGGFNKDWTRRKQRVQKDDLILVYNNSETPLDIVGCKYYCVDDDNIIGRFKNDTITLENLELFEGCILKFQRTTSLFNSSLVTKVLDVEDEDDIALVDVNRYSVINNGCLSDILKNQDIVYADSDLLISFNFKLGEYMHCKNKNTIYGKMKG